MGYGGADRRIHRVFVTRNTEYHLRRDVCVAVRDRRTGRWYNGHEALRRRVSGAIRFFETGGVGAVPSLPDVGQSLYFEGAQLVTSPVVKIERPPRYVLNHYIPVSAA